MRRVRRNTAQRRLYSRKRRTDGCAAIMDVTRAIVARSGTSGLFLHSMWRQCASMRVRILLPMGLVIAMKGLAMAGPSETTLGWRPGGDLLKHVNQATKMIQSGKHYRVVGDQFSAAAMQVLFIESQFPERICASKRAKLHFHLAMDTTTKQKMKVPDWAF